MRMYIYLFPAVFCHVLSALSLSYARWHYAKEELQICDLKTKGMKHKKNGQISWFQVGYGQWLERFYVAETEV